MRILKTVIPTLLVLCSAVLAPTRGSAQNGQSKITRFGTAYDPLRGVIVTFGGSDGTKLIRDTWEWDGCLWTLRATNGPPTMSGAVMAYHPTNGGLVLFGGDTGGSKQGDTWVWNGSTWSKLSPSSAPSPRDDHAMAYDSSRNVILLFGGSDNSRAILDDTWEWNGMTWTRRSPSTTPPRRNDHVLAYDSHRERTVLFGGVIAGNLSATWEWDGDDWTLVATTGPSGRRFPAMTYDPIRRVTVLFGGSNPTGTVVMQDTWTWNGTVWTQLNPANSPAARAGHGMIFFGPQSRTILFGGHGVPSSNTLGDTWRWDGRDWIVLNSCVTVHAPLDIKPTSCPNPLNVKSRGVLPVALLGIDGVDLSKVDLATIRLEGVLPLRIVIADVAAPFVPIRGRNNCLDCTTDGADGRPDLLFIFSKRAVVNALGAVIDGQCVVLTLKGKFTDGRSIEGEDVVRIVKKGK